MDRIIPDLSRFRTAEVRALINAMWQLLDDMGKNGVCVCMAAKAQARVAYEPFNDHEDEPKMTMDEAKAIIEEQMAIDLKTLEPAATQSTANGDALALFSIAISMKRIADAMEGGGLFKQPINSYGEGIGDAIQGQLVRGQSGISQYER